MYMYICGYIYIYIIGCIDLLCIYLNQSFSSKNGVGGGDLLPLFVPIIFDLTITFITITRSVSRSAFRANYFYR